MIIKKPSDIKSSEITPEPIYQQRRQFIQGAAALGASALLGVAPNSTANTLGKPDYPNLGKSIFNTKEALTPYKKVTTYNNFYEFGTDKSDPARNATDFVATPWSITISGEVDKPGTYTLEDILKPVTLEERIYRLRCVESWSMVIPWVGFSLADLLKRFQPTSKAKYVAFETLHDANRMSGQKNRFTLAWPYVEGLRMDEAMNPLTLMSVGLYGKVLPNQNGAPIRLVVPWKYGFKSIKSIVRIHLTDKEPPTSWNRTAPKEYGFYANVNPEVDHPRWSQAKERRLGGSFFSSLVKQETLMFNGYGEQVADMYKGMDLRQHF